MLISAANSMMKSPASQSALLALLKDACRSATQEANELQLWGEHTEGAVTKEDLESLPHPGDTGHLSTQ